MSAYNVGIILVMLKLAQFLLEILFDKDFPPMLSLILLGLFGGGVGLIIVDLLLTGVSLWISLPIITVIIIGMICLVRIEIYGLTDHKNKNK